MAVAGGTTAAIAASQHASSYRVKLLRREFLRLVEIAKPRIIYHRKRMYFFAFDARAQRPAAPDADDAEAPAEVELRIVS